MWYGFILSAILVAYFVSRITKTLRDQDRLLAAIRAEQLHAEQILALGTLAAGTAHVPLRVT
jgi:two-component system sensor histidine kinase RegB